MNYYQYIRSKEWRETKDYFALIKKKECFCCKSKKFIDLHHKHYKSMGYEDGSELEWLCRKHHKEVHTHNGVKITPDSEKNIKICDHKMRLLRFSILGTPSYHHTKKEKKEWRHRLREWRLKKKSVIEAVRSDNRMFNLLKIQRLGLEIPKGYEV